MINIVVELKDEHGKFIPKQCTERYSANGAEEMLMTKAPDRFVSVVGDGKAKVRRALTETVGGPGYSSVRVHVEIELTCNQDFDTVHKVSEMLFNESLSILDTEVDIGMKTLIAHVGRNNA